MMGRYHREWTDQFSDYLSGELRGPGRALVEEHVGRCSACREVLAQVSEVLALAGSAPDLDPPRDLWPGVAASIGAGVARRAEGAPPADVIALPTPLGHPLHSPRPLLPLRLAAAAVLLVAISVGSTWWITSGRALETSEVASAAALPGAADLASDELSPPAGLADQLRVLEQFLVSARETLDPATVLVLERNLNAIEAAIGDSRAALTLEPDNAFLMEHLERMYRQKLLYLQDAVRVVEWSS